VVSLRRTGSEFDARSGVLDLPGVGSVVVVAVPVSFAAPDAPERYLVAARPVSDIRAGDGWVLVSIALSALVALAVAWLLGTWLARRITGPLVRLTEGARGVAAGEWGRQVLRTPVTSIRGFAQAIGDGVIADELGVRRAAGIIIDEADRLTDLTSTLLSLADLDSGAVAPAKVPVDTTRLTDTLRTRFAARAAEAGVALDFELGDGRPVGDSERLLQAVSGILENAFAHAEGATRVRLRSEVKSGVWRLEIEDDGPGMAPEDREKVFGRFTRLDPSRSSNSGGSGLGLAICRRVVELMGGRVWADESPGLGGARFNVELPAE
jgi:signal transduction histidine kinase